MLAGDPLLWRHCRHLEAVRFVRWTVPSAGARERAVVELYDGTEIAVHGDHLARWPLIESDLATAERAVRSLERLAEWAPLTELRASDDPRLHLRAMVGLLALVAFCARYERPAGSYWATVQLEGAERHVFDCGHKHRRFRDVVECALAGGPRQSVVRWRRGALDLSTDAAVALEVYRRSLRDPGEWAPLGERWQTQRVVLVKRNGLTFFDGSKLGGGTDGNMDSERPGTQTAAEDHTEQNGRPDASKRLPAHVGRG